MSEIVSSALMAGLNIAANISNNAAIERAAKKQYNANKLFIERDTSVAFNSLLQQGSEINRQLGMQLSSLNQQANKATAQTAVSTTERNAYGATAAKLQQTAEIGGELVKDSLVQQAEAKMTDLQSALTNAKYEMENRHIQNANAYDSMMSQRKSTFEILTEAAGAGVSGYGQAQQMSIAKSQLTSIRGENNGTV